MKKALVILFSVDDYSLDILDNMSETERYEAAQKDLDNCDIYTLSDFCADINNGEDCLSEYYAYPVYVDEDEYKVWYK